MQYCIYSPLLCLNLCWVTSVNQGSLWVRKKDHWPTLSSNTDLHRQAGRTPRWLGDIQLLYAAHLPDSSISLFVLISPCQNWKTSVCLLHSSTGCIPLVYLAVYQTPSSPFSSGCYLITCASVFAAGLSPSCAQHIKTGTKRLIDSTPLLSNAVCCTLLVWHGYCSQQWFMFFVFFPRNLWINIF